MNTQNSKKILTKIKKLLNLAAKSGNSNEASNALSKAQALMQKHNLSSDDIDMADINHAFAKLDQQKPPEWVTNLLTTIMAAFGCKAVLKQYLHNWQFKTHAAFIGAGPNPEIAQYTFNVLHRQLKKARSEYIKAKCKRCKAATKTARGDAFAEHWVYAVYCKIEALVVNDNQQALIVRYKDEIMLKGGESKTYQAKSRAGNSSRYDDARSAGYREGNKAQLNSAVSGQEQGKLENIRA